jgi:ATP-binding protein involved in chromosome partitioning
MSTLTEAAVLDALRTVTDPDLHRDIVALGFVKNLKIGAGRVAFTVELTTPACPVKDLMRDQAHAAVSTLPGVVSVDIEMTASVRASTVPGGGKAPIEGVKNIIAVGAGKGGVGKTTMAVNLAAALAKRGSRVGILDGDIYGPNVPLMLGLNTQLQTDGQKILPAERHGIQVVSVAFLTDDDSPIIWRGPMLHQTIQQFFREVRWTDLDYLIVDMPPGTGDVALSLSQSVPVAGAVLVTTPQSVSVADTRRAVHMYRKLNIPTLGLIENMSHFGKGGGERLATDLSVPFLGCVPLQERVRSAGDAGVPIVIAEPDSAPARAIMAAAERVAQQVSIASFASRAIPLTEVR